MTQIDAQNWKDGAVWPTTRTVNAYDWYDGAVTGSVSFDPDANAAGTINVSTYTNALVGGEAQLASVAVADGRPRTIVFRSDMLGQVFRRDERDALTSGDPHEVWHRYSGRQMGYVGNNGKADVDYASSVAEKQSPPGQSSFADFDLAYDAINAYEQGGRGGVYTVQAGDTLSSIASQLWGDASLWWKLAEINGLNAESTLVEGVLLIVPVGVQTNANNAATFQPYDPLEVLGNTSPTSPKPSHNKNCGGMGQVLLAVIAIAVTIATQGALAQATSGVLKVIGSNAIAAGATSAAAGSVASQAVGVAAGIQDRFSWNAVALSAIGGGVGGGIGLQSPSGWGQAAVNATAQNIITQGIGVATGLQDKFSWAGVAAAGVGGAIGHAVGNAVGATSLLSTPTAANFGANLVRSGAQVVADAATRSLIDGSDFGDNVIAALPTALGSLVGEAMMGNAAMTAVERRYGRGAFQLAQNNTATDANYSPADPGRRNWFQRGLAWWGDLLGVDGALGIQNPTTAEFSWRNFGRMMLGRGRPGEGEDVIVVTARRMVTEGPQHFGRAGAEVARNAAEAARYAAQFGRELPRDPGGAIARTSVDFGRSSYALASANPATVINGFTGGYRSAWANDGIVGVSNQAFYHAGHGALLAIGPELAPTRGLSAEETLLFSLRPGQVADDFVGPRIGRSGFGTTAELSDAVFANYQRFYDEGYEVALAAQADGRLTRGAPNTRIPNAADEYAMDQLRVWAEAEGLNDTALLRIDRAVWDPDGSGLYRHPDAMLSDHIFDGSVGLKWATDDQIIDFRRYSGINRVTIVRPPIERVADDGTVVWGSYSIWP